MNVRGALILAGADFLETEKMQARPKSKPVGAAELQPRLRFVYSDHAAFGPGKAELLKRIASTGSIRSAASRMAMSYNRAWGLVRDMNRQFREPLVVAVRGGGSGGGANVTHAGEELLRRYLRMERACHAATRADWRAVRRLLR